MRRADRLFQIVLLLGRGRAVTAHELAQALEVSERTIYRDIADLSLTGVPVSGEAGVGYMMRGGYQIPPLMFDAEELAALALGGRMVQGWGDADMGKAAQRALLKIEAVIPEARRDQLTRQAMLVPDFHVPTNMVAPLSTLRRAIEASRKVRFDYTRADGSPSTRTVWPAGLFFWGGSWTLGGWCELRGQLRTFRLDRMGTLETLTERFDSRGGELLEDYIRAASG
ncbi:MAG: DNA-binding transcriptional regulator [Alphaproteobacteria bacterium CG_4_10_14_0_2_um_filter_63_37]|nr:MAG: DNA-binding transcriptional regulator [Proteobacteria bacterium CG1_02_64_396]PJA25721.1 MAG: DNA-binding transcriptional regulator [Alphaproteobacteria bacterium CG_4_10_14_0_2_um_filter_63_37]